MPYIDLLVRERLDSGAISPHTAGELNYEITKLINRYMVNERLRYQTINDVVGALEGAKAEFQRRVVGPYEDTKISTNGDVYDQGLLSRPDVGTSAI